MKASSAVVMALAVSPLAVNAASPFQRRDSGGGGHDHGSSGGHGHAPQASSFGGNAGGSGYAAPAPSSGYDQPSSGYDQPSSGYDQPSTGYDQPSQGYGQVSSGYGEEEKDLSPIIIGILVLTGLSLLFPTYVSLTSVKRRKRGADQEEGKDRSKENRRHNRIK